IVGIDLGTTFSCVAVWDPKLYDVKVIKNNHGNRVTPSCLVFTDTVQLVGEAAVSHSIQNTSKTVFSTKQLLGRTFYDIPSSLPFSVINVNDLPMVEVMFRNKKRTMTPEEIASRLLGYLRRIAEQYLQVPVTSCVITVPTYFNRHQRQATRDAATLAGLKVHQLVNEPTAAALAFAMHNRQYHMKNHANHTLVFDFGGATFDVSILTIANDTFQVCATGGHTNLGGETITNVMLNHIISHIKVNRDDWEINDKQHEQLRAACEQAKITLAFATRSIMDIVDFYGPNDPLHTIISRDKFNSLIKPIIGRTLSIVQDTLHRAQLDKTNIDDLLLIGGSSRIPKVRDMVAEFFDNKPLNGSVHPDEAIATGAAIHAAVLSGAMDRTFYGSCSLYDVAPLSFGTDTPGNVMDILISRHTPLPAVATKTYYNAHKFQTKMDIKVYQGERKQASANILLGLVTLGPLFPTAQRGECGVDVTFSLNVQGILTVQAKCKKSAQYTELQFSTGNLSKTKIKRMVKNAKEFEVLDDNHVRKEKARQTLESYCFSIKALPDDDGTNNDDVLVNVSTEMIRQAADEVLGWVDNHRLNLTREDYERKHGELKEKVEALLKDQKHTRKSKYRRALEDYCDFVMALPDDEGNGLMALAHQEVDEALLWVDRNQAHATRKDYKAKRAELKKKVEEIFNDQKLGKEEDKIAYFTEEIWFAAD
ncbi:heat shock protein 70 family, partial [Chlamydoabsidia padenii]